ncbi:MAG: TolC family protein [Chryseotalea sp.]
MKRYFFFLSLLFTAALVQAQERLSLEAAIAKGLSNNFEVNITKLSLDAAKLNNNWGQAGRYPTINLIVNNNNNIVQRKPANPFAVAGRNISDNINGQLDVQFILFDGLAVNIRKERLTQLEELSAGNATLVMENAVQQMILGYYTVLVEKERLKVLQTNLAFSKERYGYVKLRKELGSAITFDVLQEQNNYLTDSANVLRQEINYKNAVRNLNELINEDLNKQYTFTDSLYFDQQTYSFDDLRAKMASTNTNLRNQFINQELLRNAVAQQRALQSPTVSLNLGATGSLDRLNAQFRTNSGELEELVRVGFVKNDETQPVFQPRYKPQYQTQTGDSYGAFGNIGIRWTLFNGTQIKRAIKTAEIQEKIGAMSTDQLKLSLENDLAANFDVYILRMQLVKISETKYKAAELNLQLANERYKNGALSAIDLRIVQENFRNAALENYTAIFEALQTQTELVRLTGGLLAENQKL